MIAIGVGIGRIEAKARLHLVGRVVRVLIGRAGDRPVRRLRCACRIRWLAPAWGVRPWRPAAASAPGSTTVTPSPGRRSVQVTLRSREVRRRRSCRCRCRRCRWRRRRPPDRCSSAPGRHRCSPTRPRLRLTAAMMSRCFMETLPVRGLADSTSRHEPWRHARRRVAVRSLSTSGSPVAFPWPSPPLAWPPDVPPGHRICPDIAVIPIPPRYIRRDTATSVATRGLLLAEQRRLPRWRRIPTRRRPSLAQTLRKDRVSCSRAFQGGTPSAWRPRRWRGT